MEGNIERGSSRREETRESKETREIESIDERIDRVLREVERENIERRVKETAEELEPKESRESEQVEKWVKRTVREIVEEENDAGESGEIAERWTKEVVRELLEEEKPEVPETEEIDDPSGKPWEIRSEEELDRALERHSDLKTQKEFDQLHQDAAEYSRLENKEDVEPPELVRELEYRELRRAYETVHGGPPEVEIESMKEVDDLLEKNPEAREEKGFDEKYRHCDVHFKVKDDHSMKRDELGEKHGVSHSFVSNSWNDIEPNLIQRLRGNEEDRILREWAEGDPEIDTKTIRELRDSENIRPLERTEGQEVVHQVENQVIREAMEPLKDVKEPTTEDMVSAIERMVRAAPDENHRFHCTDVQPELETRQIKQLERHLQANREEIEESLSKNLGIEEVRARVAVVEGRMYTWVPKHRPDELVKAYEDQFYYFRDNKEVVRVIDELRKELGVEGTLHESFKHLNKVVRQLMEGDEGSTARAKPLDAKSSRLEGKIIRMYLDATGRRLSDLEGRVTKVTGVNGQAGIENPKFPEGKDLQVLKAKLTAIIASDCYLGPSGRITYNEAHLERIDRVQDIARELGDITLEGKFRKGVYEVHIQNQIGLMMIREGMTPGNKTINNPGLPEGYYDWCDEAKCAYLEELIPEDGSFHPSRGFSWTRSNALFIHNTDDTHEFRNKIGPEEIRLIQDYGNSSDGLIIQHELSFGVLKELQNSDNPEVANTAKNLVRVVLESPNNLLNDETRIANNLGMEITKSASCVKYFQKSGNVSVKHTATTTGKEDAIRWAQICPPNDERKREEVEEWLRNVVDNWLDKEEWVSW